MAQTMHAHIEVKCHGTWQHYANPIVKRGHGLFELVDGRDENSICRHRGLPKDASLIASACHHEMSRDGVYGNVPSNPRSFELFPLFNRLSDVGFHRRVVCIQADVKKRELEQFFDEHTKRINHERTPQSVENVTVA